MIFVTENDRLVILAQALKAREEEILQYQINIDNFRYAIEDIKARYPMGATEEEMSTGLQNVTVYEDMKRINAILFANRLSQLLIENELEQDKAAFILGVIQRQLEGMDVKSLISQSQD